MTHKPVPPDDILIIDDNPYTLKLLAEILTEFGFPVRTANDGNQALDLVIERQPALIVTDVQMPGMDGYELCRRLKASPATREIPIIFISGLGDPMDKSKAFGLGAVDYILKPFELDEVLARIRTHLNLRMLQWQLEEKNLQLQENYDSLQRSMAQQTALGRIIDESLNEIYIIDPQTLTFLLVNRGAREHLGYSPEELTALTVAELTADEPPLSFQEKIAPLLREEEEQLVFESNYRCKNGKTYPVEVHLQKSTYNGAPAIFAITLDISDRKHAELENAHLENRLRQAQKMEAIGILAGGIAHDFNNILGAIIGYADMAREELPANSAIARDLDKVLQAGGRAKELVKQILAFSRQTSVERIPFQPSTIIKEALKMLRSSIPSTITIHDEIDPQCGIVCADPTQLHQILINLCTNAYHAMEEGGGELLVSLRNRTITAEDFPYDAGLRPGPFVELVVADNGAGIDPVIKERIFEPYFTTKEVGKGTGMGLAIVHGIVKSLGGTITVESELGQGTTFQVLIPLSEQKCPAGTDLGDELPGGNERILFVDDEELLVSMAHDLLKRLGYRATTCTDSQEALAIFQADPNQFDLVITDQTMPHLTGAEMAKKMLQLRPDLPIILCTGYSATINPEKVKEIGIMEYVFKPLVRTDFAKLIRKTLNRRRAD